MIWETEKKQLDKTVTVTKSCRDNAHLCNKFNNLTNVEKIQSNISMMSLSSFKTDRFRAQFR